ncbi:DUF3551 domain-containing protein [Rhodopseudomonas telluris]|uniref:DUF3551 domain-containing protein n=1 Tax=Rhodopseudomonas telluris TaxID=644215 RepID=A0ABV6EY64_9BRAD
MRLHSVILAAGLGLPVAWSSAAVAQPYDNYPVCLRVYGPVRFDECRYVSIDQCRPSATGIAGQCITNPWYQPPSAPARRHRGH